MKYVLIAVWFFHNSNTNTGSSATTLQQEFETKERCEIVKKTMLEKTKADLRYIICAEK